MNEAIELLREYRAMLKAKGKALRAHAINNAIQYLQRKQKEANEQRIHDSERVDFPEDEREILRQEATTVPPEPAPDSPAGEPEKLAAPDDATDFKTYRQALFQKRNEDIIRRVKAGEKRYVIAMDYGMSPNTVSAIAINAGLPPYKRYNVRNTTKELTK